MNREHVRQWRPGTADEQCGVFTVAQALDAGLSLGAAKYRIRSGAWKKALGRGYVLASQEVGFRQRCHAAALTWPDAVITGPTAVALWRLPMGERADNAALAGPIHLSLPSRRRPISGIRSHTVAIPEHEVTRSHGLRVTSQGRTIVDALAESDREAAERLVGWCVPRKILPIDYVAEAAIRRRGRRGNRQLRTLGEWFSAEAASYAELRFQGIMKRAGIDDYVPNASMHIGGRLYSADALFRDGLIVEIDGWKYHGAATFVSDRERQNAFIGAGHMVIRLTWEHLQDPEYVVETVTTALKACRAARGLRRAA